MHLRTNNNNKIKLKNYYYYNYSRDVMNFKRKEVQLKLNIRSQRNS